MFGRIPTVPLRRLGFDVTSSPVICGSPFASMQTTVPERISAITATDDHMRTFSRADLIFLTFYISVFISVFLPFHYKIKKQIYCKNENKQYESD